MLVSHYGFRFVQLFYFTPKLIIIERKKARKFLKGLRANIYDQLVTMRLATYAEALDNAQLVEELLVAQIQ